jgi:hypothetical protein
MRRSVAVLSRDGHEIQSVEFDAAPLKVGRDRQNDIVLEPDPLQLVSREHRIIEQIGQRCFVRDLDSRNHVYIERAGDCARVDRAELVLAPGRVAAPPSPIPVRHDDGPLQDPHGSLHA